MPLVIVRFLKFQHIVLDSNIVTYSHYGSLVCIAYDYINVP